MKKWIDFMAILAFASVGVIGTAMLNQADPIPDAIIVTLFGAGMISSVILVRPKYPLINIGEPPTFLRNRSGGQEEAEIKNEIRLLQRARPRW